MERTKKGKSAKNRIVTAAWQLFHEKGYNGTTVDDIIALSGTSKGSFITTSIPKMNCSILCL